MARMPRPWYRAARREWFTTMHGQQVPLGVSDPADEGAAWEALRALQKDLAEVRQVVVTQAKAAAPAVRGGTLPGLVREYLAERAAEVEPITLAGYTRHLKWLADTFPDDTAASLSLTELGKKARAVGTWGDTHRANVLATAGALLKWAGRAETIPLPPKASRGADSVIPEPVYRRCLAEAGGDFRQLLRFLWLTGCRPGEATGLRAEDVGWESGTITLKWHKTRKKGKARIVYLAAEALEVLTDQRAKHGTGLLFRGIKGRRFSLQAMTMRFERLSAKVGHPVTSYMFRHTWATRALAKGIPAAQVAEMMGHSSTAMIFRHYAHLTSEAALLKQQADVVAGKAAG